MLVKTRGIVFRSFKYRDTSLIVDIYTEEKGLRSYIVNGVRKSKATNHASLFQITSLLDLVVYDKDGGQLSRIKEIKRSYVYQSLPYSVIKGAIAQFMIEVTKKALIEKEQNKGLFEFLHHSFVDLDNERSSLSNFPILYLWQLASYLGIRPEPIDSTSPCFFHIKEGRFWPLWQDHTYQLDEQVSRLMNTFLQGSIPSKMENHERKKVLESTLKYFQYHIEGFGEISSHHILAEILH